MAPSLTVLVPTDGNTSVLARKVMKLNTVRYDFLAFDSKDIHKFFSAPKQGMVDLLDLLSSFYLICMQTNWSAQLDETF